MLYRSEFGLFKSQHIQKIECGGDVDAKIDVKYKVRQDLKCSAEAASSTLR